MGKWGKNFTRTEREINFPISIRNFTHVILRYTRFFYFADFNRNSIFEMTGIVNECNKSNCRSSTSNWSWKRSKLSKSKNLSMSSHCTKRFPQMRTKIINQISIQMFVLREIDVPAIFATVEKSQSQVSNNIF